MAHPAPYTSQVTVPLPSDEAFTRIAGEGFDPAMTLNVFKMFSGTEVTGAKPRARSCSRTKVRVGR